jgi:hypothetical protein
MGQNLCKDSFDRNLDRIMAHYTSESPRSLAQLAIWQNASQSNNELRVLLKDPWVNRRDDGEQTQPPAARDPAMAFFPVEWSNCLTEETIAELIVDAYSGAFCDAFLDGAIALVEVANKMNLAQDASLVKLQQSISEPSLQRPGANRRLRNTAHTDKGLLSLGLSDQEGAASAGFTMNGLTKDPWDAWNSRNFHKCKALDPFMKRIERATEIQRPQRRIVKRVESSPDLRKFVLPMSATHFPEAWNRAPEPEPAARRSVSRGPSSEVDSPERWLLKVGNDGKTTFPYSLVSHRAFLDSRTDPIIKAKAHKIAPLRLTTQL